MSDEVIIDIPLAQLHDSPFNPRTTFNEAKLLEMAETMRPPLGRVQQPIVVRPVQLRPLLAGADTFNDYQIVFGHRRRRAAELAGLDKIRAIVRSMTDEEVKRAQIVENLQREDVHPIEEAEGFDKLMREHGISADQIAEQTGSSRSYVYGRLKLLQAVPTVRDACLRGEIGSEVALLIARLRHAKLQERALKAIEAKYLKLNDGGKKSYREIKRLLAEMFTLDLKSAVFDPEDAGLVASAGVCSGCDKLSGNAPEFTDLTEKRPGIYPGHFEQGNPRLCTDPVCWDAKHKAHLVREAERMRAAGKVVVDGNKARAALSSDGKTVKGAYLSLAEVKTALKASGKKSCDLPIVNIQDQRTGKTVQAVAAAELKAIGAAKPVTPKESRGYHQLSPAEREKQEKEQSELAKRHDRLLQTCVAKLRDEPRSSLDLEMLTAWALEQVDYWNNEGKWLAQRWGVEHVRDLADLIPSMSADEKGVLLMTIVMTHDESYWMRGLEAQLPERIQKIAAAHGVDLDIAMAAPMPDEIVETAAPQAEAARSSDEDDDETTGAISTPAAAAHASDGAAPSGKNSARYRNQMTGETWSGRGLQPKWLKVAIAGGKTLADFEVSTPPPAGARPKVGKSLREMLAEKAKLTGQVDLIDAAEEQPGPSGQEVKVEAGVSAGGGVPAEAAMEGVRA